MLRRLNPVAKSQRAYVGSHPLGLWLSLGIAITGVVNIIAPDLGGESSATVTFSPLVLLLFDIAWAAGGTLSFIGLVRGKRKLEGAGMSMLAGGMLSLFLAIFSLRPASALAGLFILCLGIGCALRALHLATHAYVNLDLPVDQPGVKK